MCVLRKLTRVKRSGLLSRELPNEVTLDDLASCTPSNPLFLESLLSSPKPETSETKASSALKEKSSSSGQGPTHAAGSGHSSVLAAQSKAVRERLEEATGEFNRSNVEKDPMLAILESQPKVVLSLKAGDSGKKGGRSLRSQTKVVQEEDYPAVPLDEGDDTATHSQVEEVEELTRLYRFMAVV